MDVLYPDALKLLREYEGSIRILITARARAESVNKQLIKLGLKTCFHKIFVVRPGSMAAKEKSDCLIQANASLMVGDTKTDFEASKIANIKYRHIDHGFHSKEFIDSLE